MSRRFQIVLTPDIEGGFNVSVPALPGCFTQAETIDDAIINAKEAIEGFLEALQIAGQPLPEVPADVLMAEVEVDCAEVA